MKKHIICILFHISLYVFSQGVTIDQTLNSQQLVQQVLLNNSPCAAVSNFSTVGDCGVGRFNGIGTTFPFTDGIIIRSGTVASTQGIYSNSSLSTDCSGGNVGDTQLQDIGNANGLPNNIRDVSSISFDFTPTTNLFNFNFIFASNEYGEYQCDFGDVFAFILTNITAGTAPVNLAVIPGTSSPVSVTTIRNSLYNQNGANCSSVNPNLFNVFSQLNNPNSPINMRGYTQILNANSTVIPGNQYRIKLVIGDYAGIGGIDTDFDSAVFIEGGSFNVGNPIIGDYAQFLGNVNWTVANGSALCSGASVNSCRNAKAGNSSIAGATYQWFKNNVAILNATNFQYQICEAGTYKVQVTLSGNCIVEDEIIVEVFPPTVVNNNPIPALLCQSNGTYNFTNAQNLIFPNSDGVINQFYPTLADLNAGINEIFNVNNYSGPLTAGATIYCKAITSPGSCSLIVQFILGDCTCKTITTPSGNQNICINGDPTQLCVSTDNTNANGIKYVYFNTQQTGNTMYTGGTTLGTVTAISGNACYNPPVLGTLGSLPNIPGTYYIYAVLNPTPTITSCRPFQEFIVTVTNTINAGTISGSQNICSGESFNFTSNGTAGGTWSSSNTTVASVNNLGLVTGLSAGNANIIYQVNGTGVCPPSSASFPINVLAQPSAGTLSSLQTTICIGNSTTYTSTVTGGTWQSTDNAIAQINSATGVVTGLAVGTTTLTYTIPGSGGCPPVSATINITIIAPPVAGTLSGNQSICIGTNTIFTSTVTNGVWTSSNSNIASVLPNGTITGISAGIVTLNYTVFGTNGCANATAIRTLTVHPIPPLPIVSVPFTYCQNDSSPIDISSLVTGLPGSTINYYTSGTGGTGTTTAPIPDTSILGTQNFYVSQTVNGCESNRAIVQVNIFPIPTMTLVSPITICSGGFTSIVLGTTNNLTGVVYSWNATGVGNVISSLGQFQGSGTTFMNPTLTLAAGINTPQTITYTVTPEIGGLCKGTPMVFTVTVNPIPIVTVAPNPIPPICSGETTNITLNGFVQGTTFTWVVVQPTFGVSGFSSNQSGNSINDVLTTTNLLQGRVTYKITPSYGGCIGTPQEITVYVNPRPTEITFTQPFPVCNGALSNISITVFEVNTILKWTSEQFGVTGATNNLAGITTSGSYPINDTLTLSENSSSGYVIYTITPFLNGCSGIVKTVRVDVVPRPLPKFTNGVICIKQSTGNTYQNFVLNTQLSSFDHIFVWEFNGGTGNVFTIINGATSATYEASQVGTYRVKATSLFTGCVSEYATAIVTSSYPAQSMNVEVTNAFTDNAAITVTVAGGTGQYLYQLGNGNFQNSNIFENVASGIHVVKVIDTQGCTYLTQEVTIIHYMQFFTPNGDGYNDVWKINNLNQPEAKIYIFDRNGKLLKQISGSENAQGWDGTYIGQPLPASDYWFTIEYKEKDIIKTFKEHFTLKR